MDFEEKLDKKKVSSNHRLNGSNEPISTINDDYNESTKCCQDKCQTEKTQQKALNYS
jgi:hypothetical protein